MANGKILTSHLNAFVLEGLYSYFSRNSCCGTEFLIEVQTLRVSDVTRPSVVAATLDFANFSSTFPRSVNNKE